MKAETKQKLKKLIKWGGVLLIVGLIVVAVFAPDVLAADGDKVPNKVIQNKSTSWALLIIGWLVYNVFYKLAAFLTALTGSMLDVAMLIDNFDIPVVQIGWQIVRDLCNMGFILILLVIAFGTILRIEGYNAKSLLPRLLIVALLINFSKTIAFLIINISQALMYAFVAPFKDGGASTKVAGSIGLEKIIENNLLGPGGVADQAKADQYDSAVVVTLLFGTIFMAIAAFVFFLLSIVLIVRVIALWILVILSPFAFIAGILPKTKSLASKWWSTFMDQVFVGPAVAFFLYLALVTAISVGQLGLFGGAGRKLSDLTNNSTGLAVKLASSMADFMSFVVIIAFLIGGVIAAKQMSGWAAGAAITLAKRGGNLARRGLMGGLKYGAKGAWEAAKVAHWAVPGPGISRALKKIDPRRYWQAIQESMKEEKAIEESEVQAAVRESPLGKMIFRDPYNAMTDHQNRQISEAADKLKKGGDLRSEFLIPILEENAGSPDLRKKAQAMAAMTILAENNDPNDFMDTMAAKYLEDPNKYAWVGEAYKKTTGNDLKEDSPMKDFSFMAEMMRSNQMFGDNERTADLLSRMGNIGLSNGNYELYGLSRVERKGNRMVNAFNTDADGRFNRNWKIASGAKKNNISEKEIGSKIHPNAFGGEVLGVEASLDSSALSHLETALGGLAGKNVDQMATALAARVFSNPAKKSHLENISVSQGNLANNIAEQLATSLGKDRTAALAPQDVQLMRTFINQGKPVKFSEVPRLQQGLSDEGLRMLSNMGMGLEKAIRESGRKDTKDFLWRSLKVNPTAVMNIINKNPNMDKLMENIAQGKGVKDKAEWDQLKTDIASSVIGQSKAAQLSFWETYTTPSGNKTGF